MSISFDLTLDARDPEALAEFWRAALGYEEEPPPAPFTSRHEWLRSYGEQIADDEPVGAAWLRDPAGRGPRLCLLPVPEPKTAKNRLHLDLRVRRGGPWSRVTAEVERLQALGGRVLAVDGEHPVVMADPECNQFCVA